MPLRTVPWLNQSRQGHHGKSCSNSGTYAGIRSARSLSFDTNAYILTVRVPRDMFRVTVQRRTTRIRCLIRAVATTAAAKKMGSILIGSLFSVSASATMLDIVPDDAPGVFGT